MTMPDFIVIGAPKAGTTALHAALAGHPELFLSPVKEPKFFLCDDRPPPPPDAVRVTPTARQEWIWRRDDYEAPLRRRPAGHARRREHAALPAGPRRPTIASRRLVPDAKLIAVVRDPVDRAYSNWTHLWSDGLEPDGRLPRGLRRRGGARQRPGWAPFWRYPGSGRYGEQLEHLSRAFPRDQVHVLRYRELVDEPQATLDAHRRVPRRRAGAARHRRGRRTCRPFVADTPVNPALRRAVRSGRVAGACAAPAGLARAPAPRCSGPSSASHANRPELTEDQRASLRGRARRRHRPPGGDHRPVDFDDWRGHRVGGDVLRPEVVSAVGTGRLVVEAETAVTEVHHVDVAEAALAVG